MLISNADCISRRVYLWWNFTTAYLCFVEESWKSFYIW